MATCPPALTEASALGALARQIHHAVHPRRSPIVRAPAHLIRLRGQPPPGAEAGDVEVGLRPLPGGDHPTAHLAGLHAPADWWGIGVAATGSAHHLDPPERGAPDRAAVVLLVDRSGPSSASAVRFSDDGAVEVTTDPAGFAPEGHLIDACRRALGLGTAPPPGGTEQLSARQWLDAVMAAGTAAPGRRLRWSQVAALHPYVGGVGAPARAPEVADLIELTSRLAPHIGWDRLRAAVASGADQPVADISVRTAEWMDDGMFARALLGAYPDPEELMTHLAELVTGPARAGIRTALSAWGVLAP